MTSLPNSITEFLTQPYELTQEQIHFYQKFRYIKLKETNQKIGLITPLSHNFCESCNRVRITCTGEIYTCLGQEGHSDLRAPLRTSDDDAVLETAIRAAIGLKPKGHDFDYSRQTVDGRVSRHMSHTGG